MLNLSGSNSRGLRTLYSHRDRCPVSSSVMSQEHKVLVLGPDSGRYLIDDCILQKGRVRKYGSNGKRGLAQCGVGEMAAMAGHTLSIIRVMITRFQPPELVTPHYKPIEGFELKSKEILHHQDRRQGSGSSDVSASAHVELPCVNNVFMVARAPSCLSWW